MKSVVFCLIAFGLSGCITLSGNYALAAKDANGKPISSNISWRAQGNGIYTARNAICRVYPGAVITITDTDTGKELESESPHTCRK